MYLSFYCYLVVLLSPFMMGMGVVLPAEFSKKHLYLNVLSAGLPCELVCFTLFRFIIFFTKQDCFGVPQYVSLHNLSRHFLDSIGGVSS